MKEKRTSSAYYVYVSIFVLLLTMIEIGACYFYKLSYSDMIKNTVLALLFGILIIFTYRKEVLCKSLYHSRYASLLRFLVICECAVLISCFFPLLSSTAWILPIMWTCLALYSGTATGIVAGCYITLNAVLLSASPVGIFALYFVAGMFAVLLFEKLDEAYKIALPILITEFVLSIALVTQVVFFISGVTQMESFIMPAANLFVHAVLYIVLLKIYSLTTVHKYREIYQTINDQEYVLMKKMKEKNEDYYKTAVHTAHFSERIAKMLQLDALLIKGGSFYSDILKVERNAPDNFPTPLQDLLSELDKKNYVTREAMVIAISKKIVVQMRKEMKSKKMQERDYEKVIFAVFSDYSFMDQFHDVSISLCDVEKIKNYFLQEKMYYNFLK